MDEMNKRLLYRGRHVNFVASEGWEYADRHASGVVAVVATTENEEIILIEQYRRPVRSRVIELPAGLVGDEDGQEHDDPMAAARRELLEETGYESDSFEYLGAGPPSAGLSSEVVKLYRATAARRSGEGGGVGGEEIDLHLVPAGTIRDWLAARASAGALIDPKIWAGLWLARLG